MCSNYRVGICYRIAVFLAAIKTPGDHKETLLFIKFFLLPTFSFSHHLAREGPLSNAGDNFAV